MLAARIARCAMALVLLTSAPALAQDRGGPASRQDEARTLAEEGFKLFGRDQWKDANERFRQADALFHAPTLVVYMARCQRKLGKLVAARDLYEKALAEPIAPGAPPAYEEAKRDAKRELDELRGRIPSIQLVVTGVPPETARATIDGLPMPVKRERIELDPGPHVVEAISERAKRVERRELNLAEGAAERVEIALQPRLVDEPSATPSEATPPTAPPPSSKGSLVPAGVAFGLGGASLVVFGVTGGLALGKFSDVKSRCHGTVCLTSDAAEASAGTTLGNVSTALLVIGSAAVVTGVVLAVVRPGKRSAPAAALGSFHLEPAVGAGSVSLRGGF